MYETIFAPVTASGISAISVFRFSGKESGKVLKVLTKNKNLPEERKLVLKNIYNPSSNTLLDVCLICWMPKPNSYTGEDCFEIQCHGGLSTSQALVEACSEIKGLRLAEAGEFSKRAIINGKLDLVQAEAINEIIKYTEQSILESNNEISEEELNMMLEMTGRFTQPHWIMIMGTLGGTFMGFFYSLIISIFVKKNDLN